MPAPFAEIEAAEQAAELETTRRRPHSPLADSIAQQMESSGSFGQARRRRKYKYLDWYIDSCRAVATVTFVLFIAGGLSPLIVAAVAGFSGGSTKAGLATLVTLPIAAIIGFIAYMGQMAAADFLAVIRDIEENTRDR